MWNWIWIKLVGAFNAVLATLYSAVGWLWESFAGVWNDVWGYFLAWVHDSYTFMLSLVQPGLDYLDKELVPGGLKAAVETVTYFVPLQGLMSVVAAGFGVAAVIRLVRWIKSFVPTVGD